jgi:hypothetical protein
VIYRYTPPVDATYRVAFAIARETRTAELKNIAVSDGHGNGYAEVTFGKLSPKTITALQADASGSGRADIRARIEASTDGGVKWKPQTLYMYLQLQVAEPEVFERD